MESGNVTGKTAHSFGDITTCTGLHVGSGNGTGQTAHYIVKDITLRSNDNTN
jgi:hypothetical protein